jgi:hypothetical protein
MAAIFLAALFEGGRLLVLKPKSFADAGPIKAVAKQKAIWHHF